MNIGLLGLGAIGRHLVLALPEHRFFVVEPQLEKANAFLNEKKIKNAELFDNLDRLAAQKNLEFLVEAAAQEVVPDALKFLEKCDVLIMSVGAFTDEALLEKAKKTALQYGHKLHLPSGAIGGLDVLSACEPETVMLETRKSPKSLGRSDSEKTVVFEGPAREACKRFPKNVNVAATLAIAGIGFEKTMVRVVSDPNTHKNTHNVTIKGKTGNYRFTFENEPYEENPKTSALAAASAVALIRNLKSSIQLG